MLDSVIFWYAKGSQNLDQTLTRVTEITFGVYSLSLIVSLSFLIVAICRIGTLLKKFTEVRLNEAHMLIHAIFLVIIVLLSLTLTFVYIS